MLKPMNNLKRLYRYVGKYWKNMAAASTALVIWSLIGLVLPWAMRDLVDSFFQTLSLAKLDNITFWLIILFLVQAVIGFSRTTSSSSSPSASSRMCVWISRNT